MYRTRGVYGGWLDQDIKQLERACRLRKHLLSTGHCPRCAKNLGPVHHSSPWFPERIGELITKGVGVKENSECGNCGTNLIEFCFEDLMAKAKVKAKGIVEKSRQAAKIIKKHGKPDVEMRQTNGDMLLCYKVEREDGTLF